MNHYFPSLTIPADWVVLPFNFTDNANELDLSNDDKNEFIEIMNYLLVKKIS